MFTYCVALTIGALCNYNFDLAIDWLFLKRRLGRRLPAHATREALQDVLEEFVLNMDPVAAVDLEDASTTTFPQSTFEYAKRQKALLSLRRHVEHQYQDIGRPVHTEEFADVLDDAGLQHRPGTGPHVICSPFALCIYVC